MRHLLRDLLEEPFTPAQWLAQSVAGSLVFGAGWLALVRLLTEHMSGDAGLAACLALTTVGLGLGLWHTAWGWDLLRVAPRSRVRAPGRLWAGLLGTALLLAAGVVLLLWLLVLADSLDSDSGPRNDSFI